MATDDFESKLDHYLPKKLDELGVVRSSDDLAKKDDIKELIRSIDAKFEKQLEQSDKRFEEIDARFEQQREDFNKRFEEIDARFEQQREDFNKRFERNDERIKELIEQMDNRFDQLDQRVDKLYDRVQEMSIAFGHDFEEFNTLWMNDFLRAQGYQGVKLDRKIFIDEDYKVHTDSKEVEIDIFNEDPLVIGEVTSVTKTLAKVTKFIRKVQFLSDKFGDPKSVIFITYGFKPDIRDESLRVLSENDVKTFTLRQREVNHEYW